MVFGWRVKQLKTAGYCCHLCKAPVFTKHTVALVSPTATMIVFRMEDLFGVQVCLDDSLPQSICPKCKCRLETEGLGLFHNQACTNYELPLAVHMGALKCTNYGLGQP